MTYVMMMYMPHNKETSNTKKEQTMWDQQNIYYTSKGMTDNKPCDALLEDVVKKLVFWKRMDCKILLAGDFNDDIYRDNIAEQLADADLNASLIAR